MYFYKGKVMVIVLCMLACKGWAQQADFFIISTYDYKKAIETKLNHPGEDSDKHPYSFLHVVVDNNQQYTIEELGSYHEGIQKVYKRRNTLLYVHGDGSNMNDLITDLKAFPGLYDVNVILFAWPAQELRGKGMFGIRNYNQAKKNAAFVFDSFIHTINNIRNCDSIKQGNISLMFHSLGNVFAKLYSHYIVNNIEEPPFFDNIILNAAAVPSESHEIWTDILALKAKKKVYVNFNTNDKTLWAADAFIEHTPLLGRNLLPPYAVNVMYTDFSDILKDATTFNDSHAYYIDVVPYQVEMVKEYYKTIFNGEIPDFYDICMFGRKNTVPNMFYLNDENPYCPINIVKD